MDRTSVLGVQVAGRVADGGLVERVVVAAEVVGFAVERPAIELAPPIGRPVLILATDGAVDLDGRFLGVRASYPPGTPLAAIEPVDPPSGRSEERLFYMCGILTSPQRQLAEMRVLAEHFGVSTIGVHQASRGAGQDISRFLAAHRTRNMDQLASFPAVVAVVNDALAIGKPVLLVGHSQGALVIAAALRAGIDAARAQGLDPTEIDARLSRIRVVTMAAAADDFVDGPRYEHVVNRRDTVPYMFGPALTGHPGRGANVHFVEFDVADETGVPDTAPYFYHAINVSTHGVKGHVDALAGKAPVPRDRDFVGGG